MNIHSSCNSQTQETTQMYFNGQMVKYSCHGIPISNTKKWIIDTHNNLYEPPGNHAK